MGFFKRLFSSDYRAAVAAEAAGDLELAAERYALSGQPEAAVRVHLARADRAATRAAEITALRDGHHWAEKESTLAKRVSKRLGKAILAQAEAEGVATERDRQRVAEAAAFLIVGGDTLTAGTALESIGDDRGAAAAYRAGGHVEKLEDALRREGEERATAREEKDSYADYEVAMRSGDRDLALTAIRRAVAAAENKTEYRRLAGELEARLIASGTVTLSIGKRTSAIAYSGERLLLGRDALCDFVLRSGGISRQHAEIALVGEGASSGSGGDADDLQFILADAGSKNGTRVGGMRIEGNIRLEGDASFELGDHCTVEYSVSEGSGSSGKLPQLTLQIESGLDRGRSLRAAASGQPIVLNDLGLPVTIYFRNGRPIMTHPTGSLRLGDQVIAHGDVQLVHGDVVTIDGVEIEVI